MVVRIPNWLGDAIMATPVYVNLSKVEKVRLFGPEAIIKLFEPFPNTTTISFKKNDFSENLKQLKKYKNEVGILLPNSFSSAWLFFKAGLKERWGYAKDLRRCLLTKAVKPPKKKLHQRDYYLYLIEKLGFSCKYKELTLYVSDSWIKDAEKLIRDVPRPYIVLAPGAAYGPAKMWPKEYYKILAEKLVRFGFGVVITGGKAEVELGKYLSEGISGVYDLCGKTDLTQVAGIFFLAEAVVSNDSGLMHLASALKIPQIAIFGSTDPFATGPLNPKAKVLKINLSCSPCFKRTCKFGHYRCLREISPEEVFATLLKLIGY